MKRLWFVVILAIMPLSHSKNIPFIIKNAQLLVQKKYHNQAYSLLKESISHCTSVEDKQKIANELLRLGLYYFDQNQSDMALSSFKSILDINPNISEAHHNIGFVYTEQLGEFDLARVSFEKALALKPDNAATHFCYAITLLSSGNLIDGFKEYTWRWKRGPRSPRNFSQYPLEKQWNGEPLAHKTILLRAEQGLGDTLQFIRYAELMSWMGATVIAEVQDPLIPLVSLCPYIHKVIGIRDIPPLFDYQIPYLDIPAVVRTSTTTVPCNVPYLFVDQGRDKAWQDFFNNRQSSYKIGICWRGDSAHSDDKFMPIHHFKAIADLENVELFSLQKHGTYKNDQIPFPLYTFDTTFDTNYGNFMDTAAVMKHLDLVITVDTSVAHLAGALGIPVWIIVPFPAEWRWLTERTDSIWYPTMRIFRQTQKNNWDPVANALIQAIQEQKGL